MNGWMNFSEGNGKNTAARVRFLVRGDRQPSWKEEGSEKKKKRKRNKRQGAVHFMHRVHMELEVVVQQLSVYTQMPKNQEIRSVNKGASYVSANCTKHLDERNERKGSQIEVVDIVTALTK